MCGVCTIEFVLVTFSIISVCRHYPFSLTRPPTFFSDADIMLVLKMFLVVDEPFHTVMQGVFKIF